MRRVLFAVELSALLAGCDLIAPDPQYFVRTLGVVNRSAEPWARRPELPYRIEVTVQAALHHWGGTWADLEGVTLVIQDSPPHGAPRTVIGRFTEPNDVITVDTMLVTQPALCIEGTALVHEVGHAIIGDSDHTDPRWREWGDVVAELDASDLAPDCAFSRFTWISYPDR